jgi:hypothetical protein
MDSLERLEPDRSEVVRDGPLALGFEQPMRGVSLIEVSVDEQG